MGRGSGEEQTTPTARDDASHQWAMFAGRMTDRGRLHVESDPRTVQAYGDDPVPVIVTEDESGNHYGWIDTTRPERGPQMIQPHWSLFSMQFPYSPRAEEKAGRGRVVRLRVEDSPAAG